MKDVGICYNKCILWSLGNELIRLPPQYNPEAFLLPWRPEFFPCGPPGPRLEITGLGYSIGLE